MKEKKLKRFILTDWIAESNSIPKIFSSKILKQTLKAYQVEIENTKIWIPISQIISVRDIE